MMIKKQILILQSVNKHKSKEIKTHTHTHIFSSKEQNLLESLKFLSNLIIRLFYYQQPDPSTSATGALLTGENEIKIININLLFSYFQNFCSNAQEERSC